MIRKKFKLIGLPFCISDVQIDVVDRRGENFKCDSRRGLLVFAWNVPRILEMYNSIDDNS